jgi:hypothetical protein
MKRSLTLALLGILLMAAKPVFATAPSISVDQSGPYHWGDTITVTVEVPKLKGYQYPVVLMRCENATGDFMWSYFRRWDGQGFPPAEIGPRPIILGEPVNSDQPPWTMADGNADCTVELWAYGGLSHPNPVFLAAAPDIHVDF